ncbi:MAG TPA: efflux RND transporter permease subunit, partial [Planctomycetota bacterium]|nr:efflux RND transporter permease subunit [Planctomycetota bacterium]
MRVGIAGKIASAFLRSKLTPLVIAVSLGLGALALLATPREEEPQIRVPMVDVIVAWPGAEPAEVESRIVQPIERILWGVTGIEHIYSVSRPGLAMVTVRFKVNESNEASLVKLHERQSAMGWVLPQGTLTPIVELHSIDDVPFLTLTLWGVPGVEHIYSMSRPGMGMITVRFKVGESNEASLVKVYERQSAMGGLLPRDTLPPIVELHSIDDVPFLTLTLWGEGWSSDRLRPLAAELAQEL